MSNVWWQLLLAFGYGLLGSLIPVINGEAFVVAAIATHLIGPVEAGICLGLGQGVGKMILFQVVRQAKRLPVLHPERLYDLCLGLAGELSTFREQRRPPVYPDYRHDDLETCFRFVMTDLRQSLSMVLEQTAIPIDLQDRKHGVRVAVIADIELQQAAAIVDKPVAEEQNITSYILRQHLSASGVDRTELKQLRNFLKQPLCQVKFTFFHRLS